ncbi:MAG: GNAT family N-acetyltransferase [Candidatus Thorarchaeota archaeon]|nr:GNAT family N-acetyltransferase [Candidatus Thorarchaeota archaeon]
MDLPDGFEFGIVKTDEEVEELLKFHSIVHPDDDTEELRRQIDHLPGFSREMNYYIRDIDKDLIVSALNSIPSIWNYENIPLQNLELGWVGTLKEYRRRGLNRLLQTHFDSVLFNGKYDLSTIQGIPYYYRQFGYDFVIPMDRTVWTRTNQIPPFDTKKPPEYMKLKVRLAEKKDIPTMMELFDEHNRDLLVYVPRSKELWEIQEKYKRQFENEFLTYVLIDGSKTIGYFRLVKNINKDSPPNKSTMNVIESSIPTYDGVLRVFQFIREEALQSNIPLLSSQGPSCNTLSKVMENYGGYVGAGWKYQIRIPSMVEFLKKISPVLEKRLERTMFEGITYDVIMNTFQNCYVLKFTNGKIVDVTDLGPQEVDENRAFRSPPQDLVRLVFGAYSIKELKQNNIDFIVSSGVRLIVETLFPKLESAIYLYFC